MINLVGPPAQQDIELSGLYHDAVQTYGEGKVLGILATKSNDHELRKRAAGDEGGNKTESENQDEEKGNASSKAPAAKPDEESEESKALGDNDVNTDYIFYPDKKQDDSILLHTRSAPFLKIEGKNGTYLNLQKKTVTVDRRDQTYTLIVRYHNKEKVIKKDDNFMSLTHYHRFSSIYL